MSKPKQQRTLKELIEDPQYRMGAEVIVERLSKEQVDAVFLVTGGAALTLVDAVGRYGPQYGIRMIDTVTEQGAGFAAQGYARSTGRIGVVYTTSGPGATNAVTPFADAKLDSIPILLVTGQVPRELIGKDAFQEAPVYEMTMHMSKDSMQVRNHDELEQWLTSLIHQSLGTVHNQIQDRRPGPVHLDVPKDVSHAEVPRSNAREFLFPKTEMPSVKTEAATVYKKLKKAKRPILYAGGGIIHAEAAASLQRFSEITNVPVTTTVMGIGGMPSSHPNNVGMLGMHGTVTANYAVSGSVRGNYQDGSDVLVGIGARWDDRVCGDFNRFARDAYKIHIDVDPHELGKNVKPDMGVHADAKQFLDELILQAESDTSTNNYQGWWDHLHALQRDYPLFFGDWADPITHNSIPTQLVMQELDAIIKDEHAYITTGVGQHQMWAAQYMTIDKPRRWMTSAGQGTMGFGLPAAIGAQIAHPTELVINLDGDRSFSMTYQELATVARYDLPIKTIVFDDNGHGMVRNWQQLQYPEIKRQEFDGFDNYAFVASQYRNINFAHLAEMHNGLGKKVFGAKEITKEEQIVPALTEMVDHDGPYVLLVRTRFEPCRPMIQSMQSVETMLLQSYKPPEVFPEKKIAARA